MALRNKPADKPADAPEVPEVPEVPEAQNPPADAPEGNGQNPPAEGDKPEGDKPAEAADELSLDFLAEGGVILAEALTAETMPVRARNERQQVLDRKVKAAHENWTAKGKPGDWNSQVKAGVVVTYFPAPDKSAELKRLINKAADFHGVRVRYGSSFVVTEQHIQRFNLKPELLGHEAVSFAVLDKKARTTAATTAAAAPAEGNPPEGDNK